MLLFFAISGIWQNFGVHLTGQSQLLALLSSIHRSGHMKAGDLSSPVLRAYVLAMAVGFIATTILGIVMALKYGHRRAVLCCLAFGVLFPLVVVLITAFK